MLAALYAQCIWTDRKEEWYASSMFKNDCPVGEIGKIDEWFSKPEMEDDGRMLLHYVDACHILTCIRTKICTSGNPILKKQAWEDVAASGKTTLNIALITDCVDKQNVAKARRIFDKDVEECMQQMGYTKESIFCKIMREWFDAEDDKGISATERCRRRLALRSWLLESVDFGAFPPQTQYMRGFPLVTYEALLVHLERKIQLYATTPTNSYNARAIGSQEVESFFSTIRDMDPNGQGMPKPDDILSLYHGFGCRNWKYASRPKQVYHFSSTVYSRVGWGKSESEQWAP